MSQQQFRNVVYLSDRGGCGKWRKIWPIQSIDCVAQNTGIQIDYSQTPILDPRYYQGVNSITIQRWISDYQTELVEKLFKPVMQNQRGWLIYEIDDLMFDGTVLNKDKEEFLTKKYGNLNISSIPYFNRGRRSFEGEKVQSNIKKMLLASDFVTVTTDYLKEIYHDLYDIPMENIIAVPNLLPRYLFGDRFDPKKKIEQYKKNKNKPRIGIVSSLSHFNIDNVREDKDGFPVREHKMKDKDGNEISKWVNSKNQEVKFEDTMEITDDFDEIIDCVRETVDDFQWVCFGYCPPKLKDLVEKRKIECYGGVAIMNYPSKLENLNLQAVIAPIKKTAFNFSKSFIKYMESAALGYPLFATDCIPYNRVMPNNQLFNTSSELKDMLMKLKFGSTGIYEKMIMNQWQWLNSPCQEGDFNLRNFWLEDNLNIHLDLARLRNKGIECSMSVYLKKKKENQEIRQKNTVFSNDNGVEILK